MQPHIHSEALLDLGRGAVQNQKFEPAQAEMPCVHLYHKRTWSLVADLALCAKKEGTTKQGKGASISHNIHVQPVVLQDCH